MKYVIPFLFFTLACSSKNEQEQTITKESQTEVLAVTTRTVQEAVSCPDKNVYEFHSKSDDPEDTMILSIGNDSYIISPRGLFTINNRKHFQLKTDLIVENAYLYQDNTFFYIFFTDSDSEYATSWLQKINASTGHTEYIIDVPGFNLGLPIVRNNKAYVTAISSVGKIDLQTGKYDWQKTELYDREKYSFNSFDTVLFKNDTVEFLSENHSSKHIDKVIIHNTTGKLLLIEK